MKNTLGKLLLTVAIITGMAPDLSARTEAFEGFKAWSAQRKAEIFKGMDELASKIPLPPKIRAAVDVEIAKVKKRLAAYRMEAIHHAAADGNVKKVSALLAKGVSPDQRDTEGNTALHFARKRKMINVLLDAGANVDARNNDGLTPLFMRIPDAFSNAYLLLARGANVNIRDNNNNTPVHVYAAFRGRNGLPKGADVNAVNNMGITPLHIAVGMGRLTGADYATLVGEAILWGPLLLATVFTMATPGMVVGGAIGVLGAGVGALPGAVIGGIITGVIGTGLMLPLLMHEQSNFMGGTKDIINPLYYIRGLLSLGANVNAQDNAGNTPLHLMARGRLLNPKKTKVGVATARYLIDNGADVTIKNNAGKTPYDVAKHYARVGLMWVLYPKRVERKKARAVKREERREKRRAKREEKRGQGGA